MPHSAQEKKTISDGVVLPTYTTNTAYTAHNACTSLQQWNTPKYIAIWLECFKNITCNGLWELYDAARAGWTGGWDYTPKTFHTTRAQVHRWC